MSTKKQKISAIPEVFNSAEECAQAIESALAAMNPPLEVFGGVVKLIAEFAQPWLRFDATTGGGSAWFYVSNGMTATRERKDNDSAHFIYASPSFVDGIHEAMFRIDTCGYIWYNTKLGVVPVKKASSSDAAYKVGYVYNSHGNYFAHDITATGPYGQFYAGSKFGDGYDIGDVITVCLDLNASTVAFRKNGTEVVPPQKITRDEAYHFAFDSERAGDAVTIV